jgi:hypothetical protein
VITLVASMEKEEAATLWDEAYAGESARLDHEPENEAKSNARVLAR